MKTLILVAVLVLIVVGASIYLLSAKKKGSGCVGCPSAGSCNKNACTCKGDKKDKK